MACAESLKRRAIRAAAVVATGLVAIVGLPNPVAAQSEPTTLVGLIQTPSGGLQVVTTEVSSPAEYAVATSATVASGMIVGYEPQATFFAFESNDARRPDQWALDRVPFETTWAETNGDGITVAVVDTGVRATHEDLGGVIVPGSDFVDPGGDGTTADHFHGSHVAGIVAASTNNALGITAAAPGVRIMPVRVLNSAGSGTSGDVASGIIWATDNGADVINLSLGSTTDTGVVAAAVDYADANGVVVIAAAGNSGGDGNPVTYPAANDEVIGVGAIDSDDSRASFSAYGFWVELVAPGVNVLSVQGLADKSYVYADGTSMASPYVAAAAAMMLSVNSDLSPAEVRQILQDTASDLGKAGRDDHFGYGLVHPGDAVEDAVAMSSQTAYAIVTSAGRVLPFGKATDHGSLDGIALEGPIVGASTTTSGGGYWMVGGDGGLFAFGDAGFNGSLGAISLFGPIAAMTTTVSGNGYWMVGSDGGLFAFGSAGFSGSLGDVALNQPVVAMAVTPTGGGYWMSAADGGMFTFGDAQFHGSLGDLNLAAPVVAMAATPTGKGYWMVASDGGLFAFGDAGFYGSTGGITLDEPIVAMAPTNSGRGYWMLAADGGMFAFGDASYAGSAAGLLNPGETAVALIQTHQ